jgi:integrase
VGNIQRRRRDSGLSWDVRWRDPAGQQRKKAFHRRADAERFLATITADVIRGDYVNPNDPTTFREYAEGWREAQVHRPTTRAHVETNLRRHAYPRFGDRRLSTIRPSEIQAWVTALTRSLSPATVQVIHGIVAAIFKAAMRDRLVNSSPCEGTKLPKRLPVEVMPLSTATVQALAAAVPERYRALVILGAGTGLRQGECFGLDDEHLDFNRHTLRVEQQLVLLPYREPFLGPPKTSASHRTVPLPDVIEDALQHHLERFPVQHPDRLVFTDDGGQALRRTRFSREIWRPAVAAVGARRGTGFHDLRHFYASLLIRHGESVKTVQRRLGHATAAETLDTYAHLWPDSDDRTRDAIDEVLRPATRRAAARPTSASGQTAHHRRAPDGPAL